MSTGPRLRLAEERHGSLPVLLLVLTLVTGVIDAISILTFGRVFVANMTGNVVVTGFAIAGVPEFSLRTSLAVLAAFLVGATAEGFLIDRIDGRGGLLRAAVLIEWVLLAVCFVLVLVHPPVVDSASTLAAAVIAAVAMGIQNAVARRIGVPDLNTSVISMSMTGLVADRTHSTREAALRRALAVLSLLVGAFVGAVLVRTLGAAAAFGLILALLAAVGLTAHTLLRRGPDWEG
ncbi:YoaK family protein [Pseudonocardia yuanmonensis]|uniref:YoaK family protein n=1 Tax=Pseudonocardia yuanmonensis TaxID=1095914 RepID=A0ABP8WVA2_9PSEU